MTEKDQEDQEIPVCVYCREAMNPGATVCHHCTRRQPRHPPGAVKKRIRNVAIGSVAIACVAWLTVVIIQKQERYAAAVNSLVIRGDWCGASGWTTDNAATLVSALESRADAPNRPHIFEIARTLICIPGSTPQDAMALARDLPAYAQAAQTDPESAAKAIVDAFSLLGSTDDYLNEMLPWLSKQKVTQLATISEGLKAGHDVMGSSYKSLNGLEYPYDVQVHIKMQALSDSVAELPPETRASMTAVLSRIKKEYMRYMLRT